MKRYNIWLKTCAFLLAAACFCAAITPMLSAANNNMLDNVLKGTQSYTGSPQFQYELWPAQDAVDWLIQQKDTVPDEEFILSGAGITQRLEQQKQDMYYSYEYEIAQYFQVVTGSYAYGDGNYSAWENPEYRAYFEERYAGEIEWLAQGIIDNDLNVYRSFMSQLTRRGGELYYYYEIDGRAFTNFDGTIDALRESGAYCYNTNMGGVIAFTASYIEARQAEFTQAWLAAWNGIIRTAVFAGGFLLCLTYLLFAAGRRTADKRIRLIFPDMLYTEFTLALFIAAAFGAFWFNVYMADNMLYNQLNRSLGYGLTFTVGAVLTAVTLMLLLSLTRRLKDRTFFTHTLIYAVFSRIFGFFRRVYMGGRLLKRTVVAVAGLGLLTMIPFVGIVTVPLAVFCAARALGRLTGVQELNLNAEMDRRLRAERLRTELISNVSHDIRTPLTSVITYVDLLKAEETDNENIKKYVGVIDVKAQRLKALTDDLFEASKAASGNIPVTAEKVELVSLLTQGLGELDDKLKSSGLDFRVTAPEEKLYVLADGKLLWRVVENVLSNVFKYALAGSRVYIDVFERGTGAGIEVKNISAQELNIPEEELMERFKRGDEARAGSGSGLGLSIARSLMLAQGGTFEIKIDGDLFKASLTAARFEA